MHRKSETQAEEVRVEKWVRWQKRFRTNQVRDALGVERHVIGKVIDRMIRRRELRRTGKSSFSYVYELVRA